MFHMRSSGDLFGAKIFHGGCSTSGVGDGRNQRADGDLWRKPVASAVLGGGRCIAREGRGAGVCRIEARCADQTRSFHALLGAEPPMPFAAALVGACPHLSLKINLLPAEMRATNSRALW